jgi:hypothetical protein
MGGGEVEHSAGLPGRTERDYSTAPFSPSSPLAATPTWGMDSNVGYNGRYIVDGQFIVAGLHQRGQGKVLLQSGRGSVPRQPRYILASWR